MWFKWLGIDWILPALNASVKYDPPSANAGTATFCTW